MNKVLTKTDFLKYIFSEYRPSKYEEFAPEDNRFPKGFYYSHIFRTRLFYIYQHIASLKLKDESRALKMLDMGFYPGNLIRVLKDQLNDTISCSGVGLKLDEPFQEFMKPYLADCEYIDFDPFYRKDKQPVRLKFNDDSFDIVVASEILEHLISPLELISEGSRLLKRDGVFIITTPNVSHIGAVIRLILGKSNYERLHRSPMALQNDEWRGHIRFYDKKELINLFNENGLELIHHQYYTEEGWDHVIRSLPQKIIYLIRKMFWLIPIYREGHFAVFKKIWA